MGFVLGGITRKKVPPTTPPTIAPVLLVVLTLLVGDVLVTTAPAGKVVVNATVVVYS